jgi:hypothetical protein
MPGKNVFGIRLGVAKKTVGSFEISNCLQWIIRMWVKISLSGGKWANKRFPTPYGGVMQWPRGPNGIHAIALPEGVIILLHYANFIPQ